MIKHEILDQIKIQHDLRSHLAIIIVKITQKPTILYLKSCHWQEQNKHLLSDYILSNVQSYQYSYNLSSRSNLQVIVKDFCITDRAPNQTLADLYLLFNWRVLAFCMETYEIQSFTILPILGSSYREEIASL